MDAGPPDERRLPRIAVAASFEESAVRAITARAEHHGVLERHIRRDTRWMGGAGALARAALPSGTTAARAARSQRARATRGGTPVDVRVAPSADLVRILGGRFRSPLTHALGNAVWKRRYDRAASRVDLGRAEVLLGMPGASLRTFEAHPARRRVLHQIDGHPRVRNELLVDAYGARRARAETYPGWFVEVIEAEIELAEQVLVPGAVVGDQMRARGVPDSRLLTVPYGVDPGLFRPAVAEAAGGPTRRPPGRPVHVVCTAQIALRKGIPFLLEAVRGLPVRLTLVGQVFDRRIVRDLPAEVRLAGVVGPAELAGLYQDADLFVLPSVEDCFALVVAEAASAGLPVVTTRQNGASELLGADHVVVDAGDVGALRAAIRSRSLLSDAERERIAAAAREAGWTDWGTYGDRVLTAIAAASGERS